MYSSTSNLNSWLYKLTTWVRIPLDMEFFFITAEKFSISISQQLIMAQAMLTGTQKSKTVIRMTVENKTKSLITATMRFIRNHKSFDSAFLSTLCAIIGHFANFFWGVCVAGGGGGGVTPRPFKCGAFRWLVTDFSFELIKWLQNNCFKSRLSYLPFLIPHLLGDGWTFWNIVVSTVLTQR